MFGPSKRERELHLARTLAEDLAAEHAAAFRAGAAHADATWSAALLLLAAAVYFLTVYRD